MQLGLRFVGYSRRTPLRHMGARTALGTAASDKLPPHGLVLLTRCSPCSSFVRRGLLVPFETTGGGGGAVAAGGGPRHGSSGGAGCPCATAGGPRPPPLPPRPGTPWASKFSMTTHPSWASSGAGSLRLRSVQRPPDSNCLCLILVSDTCASTFDCPLCCAGNHRGTGIPVPGHHHDTTRCAQPCRRQWQLAATALGISSQHRQCSTAGGLQDLVMLPSFDAGSQQGCSAWVLTRMGMDGIFRGCDHTSHAIPKMCVLVAGAAASLHGGAQTVHDLLGGHLATVSIEPPPPAEQANILAALFPALGQLLPPALRMLSISQDTPPLQPHYFAGAANAAPAPSPLRLGRHFSIRDVIKWCHRMQARHRTTVSGAALQSCLLPRPAERRCIQPISP